MKRFLTVCTFGLVLIFTISVFGQEVRTLSLQESIDIALNKSYTIKTAFQGYKENQSALKAWELSLKSSADLDFLAPDFNRSITEEFNSQTQLNEFYDLQSLISQAKLSINQPVMWTNGRVSLEGRLYKLDQVSRFGGAKTGETSDYTSNFGISIVQPLFQPNTLKISGERNKLNFELSEHQFTETQLGIIFDVTTSFYNLYKATREVEIARDDVKRKQHSYDLAQNKFKAGIIAEVEALQQEVDLALSKNQLRISENNLKKQKDDFKLKIGLDLNENIEAVAAIEYKPIVVDLDKAITEALKRRPDVRDAEIRKQLQEFTVTTTKAQRKIKADLTGFIGLNGKDEDFGQALNNFDQSQSVRLNVSVPLWDWGKHKEDVQAAMARLKTRELDIDYKKQQIITEIKVLIDQFEGAKARLDIQKNNEKIAQKSYDISLERFNNGDISSEDLALSQGRLTDARTNYLNTLIDYLVAVAEIKRRTYWDFEAGKALLIPEKPKF